LGFQKAAIGDRQFSLHNGSPFKTDSGCTDFPTGRSKPVTELCKSNVGFVAMISTIAAPAPEPEPDVKCEAKSQSATLFLMTPLVSANTRANAGIGHLEQAVD
jgi:hypothetical protein